MQSKSVVTQLDYLKGVILKYQDVIIEDDINVLYNTIITNNIVDKNSKKEHIKDIKNKIDYSMNLENNMICPKCGSELKDKMGKYGKFIGCTNYPKCRYVKR